MSALVSRPVRFVQLRVFETLTGYTEKAVERKIATGVWVEGRQFRRAPDGRVLVDLDGYETWVVKGAGNGA